MTPPPPPLPCWDMSSTLLPSKNPQLSQTDNHLSQIDESPCNQLPVLSSPNTGRCQYHWSWAWRSVRGQEEKSPRWEVVSHTELYMNQPVLSPSSRRSPSRLRHTSCSLASGRNGAVMLSPLRLYHMTPQLFFFQTEWRVMCLRGALFNLLSDCTVNLGFFLPWTLTSTQLCRHVYGGTGSSGWLPAGCKGALNWTHPPISLCSFCL